MTEKRNKEHIVVRIMRFLGILSFIAAGVLIAVVIIMHIDSVRAKYDAYLQILQDFEIKVAELQNRWLIMIVIFLLYLLRSLTPMYPYTVIYIISAMVFPPVQSFLINIIGMAATIAFRYYTGVQMGEGYTNKVLKRYPTINSAFESDGRANPVVLFMLRIVPLFPFNTVSQLYGTLDFPFIKYVLISTAALIPRLVSYSFIGNNVYDPLSSSFFVPLIILLVLSGISLFFAQALFKFTMKITHKDTK